MRVPTPLLLVLVAAGAACPGADDDSAGIDSGPDPCAQPDGDGDGAASEACGGSDCDDLRAEVHPGAADAAGDGEDQDCDGDDGVDTDGDGHASASSGGDDCDDAHASIYPGAREGDWVIEVVDEGGRPGAEEAGTFPSLAIDGGGDEHIAYQVNLTETPPALLHASRRAGAWQLEAIDDDPAGVGNDRGAGWFGSLAADPATGALHVSYIAAWGTEVRHATNAGGAWAIELVQTILYPVADTSIALDPEGQPHIAYYDPRDTRLWVASLDGGTWTFEPVSTDDETGSESSLAIGDDGVAHIALRAEAGALLYATNGGGAFTVEVVDDDDGAGRSPSIARGVPGEILVAYVSDVGVRLARGRAGDFAVETVETGRGFTDTSLALDAQGVAHIAYHDGAGGGLRYATNPLGSWSLTTVDATSDAGRYASIALDGAGRPRIAYLAPGPHGAALGFAHVEPDRIDTNCDGLDW